MPLHPRLAACAFFLSTAAVAATPGVPGRVDWQQEAVRLSGESDAIHERALQALRSDPQLPARLLQVLQEPATPTNFRSRALALDVVNALALKPLTPELWKLTLEKDPGGQMLLTALALSDEPLPTWIPERLWGLAIDPKRPLAIRWVALEALARLSNWTWVPRHSAFLAQTHPQLRGVALTALRTQILGRGRRADLELLDPFLRHSDPELRLRAQQIQNERLGKPVHFPALSSDDTWDYTHAVFFGYKDSRPNRYVADRIEAAYWVDEKIAQGWRLTSTQSAPPWVLESSEKDPKTRKRIAVWVSSIGPDDAVNRKDPYQKRWSQRVLRDFEKAGVSVPSLVYVGHSRDGGGPDFAPPLLDAAGHVQYAAYPRAATLQKLGAQIRFFGLYSCASRQHFARHLARILPQTQLDLSGELIYWTDALDQMNRALSGPDLHSSSLGPFEFPQKR